jgi:predicted nucleotidyltransferase component of viral defense system
MENLANQGLLFEILDIFAQKFEQKAILRGGMVLRLLGCQRYTNDLDYVFVPFKSKNDVVKEVLQALEELPKVALSHSLNSKCLRIKILREDVSAMVEVKVEKNVPTEIVSTRALAELYNYQPRLIRVVSYPIALAHKMAAWNERRIIRDVYDTWFFLRMGVKPDNETLRKRLLKCSYSRLIKEEDYFLGSTVEEFFDFMRSKINILTEKEIENSLSDSLKKEELAGLGMMFRSEFAKL